MSVDLYVPLEVDERRNIIRALSNGATLFVRGRNTHTDLLLFDVRLEDCDWYRQGYLVPLTMGILARVNVQTLFYPFGPAPLSDRIIDLTSIDQARRYMRERMG